MLRHIIQGLPTRELAVSNWTMVEFSSLLARKIRAPTN